MELKFLLYKLKIVVLLPLAKLRYTKEQQITLKHIKIWFFGVIESAPIGVGSFVFVESLKKRTKTNKEQ